MMCFISALQVLQSQIRIKVTESSNSGNEHISCVGAIAFPPAVVVWSVSLDRAVNLTFKQCRDVTECILTLWFSSSPALDSSSFIFHFNESTVLVPVS